MERTTEFGDVVITSIEQSKNPEWSWVGFEQATKTTYVGDNAERSTGLGLMNILAPQPATFDGKRKCYEMVKNSVLEAAGLSIGSIVPGVQITSYAHEVPVKDGMVAGNNGKFYTTKITSLGSPTSVDEKREVSEKEYARWKAAVGQGLTVGSSTPTPSQPIAD